MPHAARRSFLRRLGRGAASRRGPDLADMGTAFALDEALELGAWDVPALGAPPRPIRAPTQEAAWRRWLGRKPGA